MNAVEIEHAVSELAESPFDSEEFAYAFLVAFDNKDTTIKRLKSGSTNKSDVGGVLQRNNIHIKVCEDGSVTDTLGELRDSPATTKGKVKFIVTTDGETFEAEDLNSGETVACDYAQFPDHFGFFLPLAGISTVKQIRESAFDIKATGRLNRLYIQLLKDNPDWGTDKKREEMNHFMARLIFCFFAEDTDIFKRSDLFTNTVDRMSESDASNTHEIIMELFRSMNTKPEEREAEKIARWANELPYVNGGLFAGSLEVPRFTRIARSYLHHIGSLDWQKINPDIFGSMIQAVADDEERGELGMHYTSVPNILKVLNPLFLDDLREQLEEADDNKRKLLNLRNRLAKIRVFDPACGSGNFLVIAYKQMREIEAEINKRRGERDNRTVIPVTNFRGIEMRSFSAEVARLALIIAEYQSDVLYRGQKEAIQDFLPLRVENWITCANALRIDWLSVCPPTGTDVKHSGDDLFFEAQEEHQIDFENEGGETYICGNPPYLGSTWQSKEQKADLKSVFEGKTKSWKSLDYVAGWFMKAAEYGTHTKTVSAFVSTNSICQGQQVAILWPSMMAAGHEIVFAHTSFKWSNLASYNAGVTVVIVGISNNAGPVRNLFSLSEGNEVVLKKVENINPYLIAGQNVIVKKAMKPLTEVSAMDFGNKADDGGHLTISSAGLEEMGLDNKSRARFIKKFYGSKEFISGDTRYCIWIEDANLDDAIRVTQLNKQIEKVRKARLSSKDAYARSLAKRSHQFKTPRLATESVIVTPRVSSENRPYLPVGLMSNFAVIGKEIRAAEEVANRKKCEDFEQFKELFDQVKEDLNAGTRQLIQFDNKTEVEIGDLFVLNGQTTYIATAGDKFRDKNGKTDRRLRIVFDNGTESQMLQRSFQKRLWEDDTTRRIINPSSMGPLFADQASEGDKESGTIYVLRSKSKTPFIVKHQDLIHKIGFTKGSVERRIADAVNQATYLLADVEIVATYKLFNVNANKLEKLFHKIFESTRLDIEIKDRFGKPFRPREWFLVPLAVIKEVVEHLKDGSIMKYEYDAKHAKLVKTQD